MGRQSKPEPPPIVGEVREALAVGHPLALLSLGSTFAEIVHDGERPVPMLTDPGSSPVGWAQLLDGFIGVSLPETTALLHALAPFAPAEWQLTIRAEIGRRHGHARPPWVRGIEDVEVVGVWEQGHVQGDGENLMLGARWASGHEMTIVAYIDHNMGTLLKDCFTGAGPPDDVLEAYERDAPAGSHQRAYDPATARARIEAAVAQWEITWPPIIDEEWPVARPLLLWLISLLPAGGAVPVPRPVADAEREALVDGFLSSPEGRALTDAVAARALVRHLVDFACDEGVGDPLRWSPVRIEIVLVDWIPRQLLDGADDVPLLLGMPTVLEGFVRFALRGLGEREALTSELVEELTAESIEAIDRWTPVYLRAITTGIPDEADAAD